MSDAPLQKCEECYQQHVMCPVYLQTCSWSYDPGDTIGILCPNDVSEVRSLLNLLGLSEMADATCSLEVLSDTRKRNAAVPEHLPVKSTLFSLLRTCCEIREVPRKVCYTQRSGLVVTRWPRSM